MRSCLGTSSNRCGKLIPANRNRCVECQRAKYRGRNRTRDPLPVAVYGSAAWRHLADAVVAEAAACHWCRTSRYVAKLTADHIYPIRHRPDLALEPTNVVPSCRSCQERRKYEPDPRRWPEWARRPRS